MWFFPSIVAIRAIICKDLDMNSTYSVYLPTPVPNNTFVPPFSGDTPNVDHAFIYILSYWICEPSKPGEPRRAF